VSEKNKKVFVQSKVWYTYLGKERTKYSIQKSIESFVGLENTELVMLIHWPRCRQDISWMRCEEEETSLPDEVKELGPPPHLNRNSAWEGSWLALEESFLAGDLSAIGVSNFDSRDLNRLLSFATVKPHVRVLLQEFFIIFIIFLKL
jgi:diketogulonate reductase-like aldo/keto reductase